MAKRSRTNAVEKRLNDGRGLGIGIDYKPWLKIQDVSSQGRSTRLKGIKVPRQFEFLSDLERNYFYLLEYSDYVVDIREQYPLLPIEETLLIAEELGITHPRDPKTKEPIVMTTDFVSTKQVNGKQINYARTVKPKSDLADKRVLEKFEIERAYWELREIDWGIVTEEEIDKTMALNIGFVHSYKELSHFEGFEYITEDQLEDLSVVYVSRMLQVTNSIREISQQFERDFDLISGSGISIFKYLIINKVIDVNLLEKLDVNQIISIQTIRKDFSEKVRAI
ncbi:heteromeric transposase endonuclease subunit TnsA [Anaerobacillus isosaccharinicus]|uniref:Transposase n=1 Tax=Anaerobacillus isosaccharinicus TaxID=1532552 RepID=A0A1S2L8J7_9BACI|nr:heteromeric transposase endonuclease subunit TnsA [Anaerobacillus isosaccharinicus]MBA5584002.1 heteromeric transposase endonuclease subunit TnsA [Anaerobacillus isosaccharinicus]QOY37581.1 heteromeric transposase endonuclease subunit TnsA [Anaerobacillus isosaccharinicus]